MYFSRTNHIALIIYNTLVNFNKGKEIKDRIKFIHGGSSSVFAFVGKSVYVTDEMNQTTTKEIPFSLIPTGMLRKKYNIYPVSGELEIGTFNYGKRKAGINYHFLSGMDVSYQGVCETLTYAKLSNRIVTVDRIHQHILSLIGHLSPDYFHRSLKMLHMAITNLMLIDVNGEQAGKKYIMLLIEKYQELLAQFPDRSEIKNYFNKYLPKLNDLISRKSLPFESDENFRQLILNQYPVIYCSTVTPRDFTDGLPDEKIFRGEINMETVKILFTPTEFVDSLRKTLDKLSLTSIQVIGYSPTASLIEEFTPAPSSSPIVNL